MYEEGFRWWRMGYAAADAFVLFIVILVAHTGSVPVAEGNGHDAVRSRQRKHMPALRALISRRHPRALPMIWMVSASLMPPGEANTFPPHFFPTESPSRTTATLFTRLNLGRYLLNSAFIALVVTVLPRSLVNSMAGYAFAKLRFRGRDTAVPLARRPDSCCRCRSRCFRSFSCSRTWG